MKAIIVENDKLVWKKVPHPKVRRGEVLIDVHATAVNRADLSQIQGRYHPPPGVTNILGLECAGEVCKVGEGVSSFVKGDKVCALLAGGGYAEQVNVPAGQVLPIPKEFDYPSATALPEVFATAYLNLFIEAQANTRDKVLLHAGASGVGTAAIQLCRVLNVDSFVTVGSDDKLEFCVNLGASAGFNRHNGDFTDAVKAWSGGKGVDVILDPVGAHYLESNLSCLNTDGRLVIIGLMGGAKGEVPLGRLMVKRQRIIGSTLRARPISAKSQLIEELKHKVWPLIEAGEIRPIVNSVYPIEQAQHAVDEVANNQTIGKVILKVR